MIHIQGLHKTYMQGGREIKVLNNLNFQTTRGQSYAIIGQSGSGKSTLLHMICGLDDADSGSITIDGHELTVMSPREKAELRRSYHAIIFQEFYLMEHLSALENVMLALDVKTTHLSQKQNVRDMSIQALQDVGLKERLHHLPGKLSGGEKQRVAIARAFATHPQLLIADEPSGNLDPKTGDEIMSVLWSMLKKYNTTLILVTHNHQLAARCHTTYILRQGRLHRYQHEKDANA